MKPLKMKIFLDRNGVAEVRGYGSQVLMKMWVEKDGELCVRVLPSSLVIIPEAANQVTVRVDQ